MFYAIDHGIRPGFEGRRGYWVMAFDSRVKRNQFVSDDAKTRHKVSSLMVTTLLRKKLIAFDASTRHEAHQAGLSTTQFVKDLKPRELFERYRKNLSVGGSQSK